MNSKPNYPYIIIFFIINLFIIVSCTKGPTIQNIEKGIYHSEKSTTDYRKKITILPGDTLLYISKKYRLTIKEIIKFNKLKTPYILKPGKYLYIPQFKVHKIKKGDTLFKIAKCYSISVKDIEDKNKSLRKKNLNIGFKIRLPYYAIEKNCYKSKKRKIKKKNKNTVKSIIKPIFIMPTKGKIIDTFGNKEGGRRNDGINILAPLGNPVRAALKGKVIYKGNEIPSWGNLIIIKHTNGWSTLYAHLDKFIINSGEIVNAGDIIGSVGATGNVESYQLHFQVRRNAKPLDPQSYIKSSQF